MSYADPYSQLPPPPSAGNFPDQFKFINVGQSVEGYLAEVRTAPPKGDMGATPVIQLQTTQVGPDGQPVSWSVFCGPTSLWRQLDSHRPPLGSYLRITFVGFDGQAKLFNFEVLQQGNGQGPAPAAPVAQSMPAPPAPAPATAPAPAFGQPQPGPAPWEAPQTPAPQTVGQTPQPGNAAPPWGQ